MSFNQKNRKFQGFPALNYGHKFLEEGLDLVPLAYRLESLSYKCLISLQRCISYQVSLLHAILLCSAYLPLPTTKVRLRSSYRPGMLFCCSAQGRVCAHHGRGDHSFHPLPASTPSGTVGQLLP